MLDIYLFVVILFALSVISVVTYKIYKFVAKCNRLYKYFMAKETGFTLKTNDGRPPINGECPTEEELNEFENR